VIILKTINSNITYLGKYFKFQTLSKYLLRFRESIRLPFNSSATCLAIFFRSNSIQPSVKCLDGLFFRFAKEKNSNKIISKNYCEYNVLRFEVGCKNTLPMSPYSPSNSRSFVTFMYFGIDDKYTIPFFRFFTVESMDNNDSVSQSHIVCCYPCI